MEATGESGHDEDRASKRARRQEYEEQPTFGDIMPSKLSPFRIHPHFSAAERLVLTANGNLQRLISSYYNSPVTVTVEHNRPLGNGHYERLVTLSVLGTTFCKAESTIELKREDCIDAVEKKGIAIGQLFRHFDVLPTFQLIEAARAATGAFQRTYVLMGTGISCYIHENFSPGLFALRADPQTLAAPLHLAPRQNSSSHFGDLMAPNQTGLELPEGFSPLQRLLLTANGNVQRLVSSYYYPELVDVQVLFSHKNGDGSYDRQTCMSVFGKQFMSAKTAVHLIKDDWAAALDSGVPLGGLFRHMGVLPTFVLHSVGKARDYIWRVYSLRSEGMACEISETFSAQLFTDAFRQPTPEKRPDDVGF